MLSSVRDLNELTVLGVFAVEQRHLGRRRSSAGPSGPRGGGGRPGTVVAAGTGVAAGSGEEVGEEALPHGTGGSGGLYSSLLSTSIGSASAIISGWGGAGCPSPQRSA